MKEFEVAEHEPSLLPEGKRFRLVWSDEFDGTELDRTKWDYRAAMMGKVHPARTDDGATLDGNGNDAVFTLQLKNGMPSAPGCRSATPFLWTMSAYLTLRRTKNESDMVGTGRTAFRL